MLDNASDHSSKARRTDDAITVEKEKERIKGKQSTISYLLMQLHRDWLLHRYRHVLRHFYYLRHRDRHWMFHRHRKRDVMRHLEKNGERKPRPISHARNIRIVNESTREKEKRIISTDVRPCVNLNRRGDPGKSDQKSVRIGQ